LATETQPAPDHSGEPTMGSSQHCSVGIIIVIGKVGRSERGLLNNGMRDCHGTGTMRIA
jgi:hypothetical protein